MYANFQSLLKDLEPFIHTDGVRLAFDKDDQAFLIAPDFSEPLAREKESVHGSIREEMRQALAKHRSIHAKNADPFANAQDIPTPQPE